MRSLIRFLFLLFCGLFVAAKAQAHLVKWLENPSGYFPSIPITFYYPNDIFRIVSIAPEYGETCTVTAVVNPSTSTLVNATLLTKGAANTAYFVVQVLRAPSNHLETALISGYWSATGLPANMGCDATNQNPFTVPITVSDQPPRFLIGLTSSKTWANLDMGFIGGLQHSSCITGPFWNVGFGQTFTVPIDMRDGFFRPSKQLGGTIAGVILDRLGNPAPGFQIGLIYGGAVSVTDPTGVYVMPSTPVGMTGLSITNATNGVSLNVGVTNSTNDVAVNWQIDTAFVPTNAPPPTNACNCTPWCAIGFGSTAGGITPIYYAGGANGPKTGANCGQAQVTVTPPSGPPITIRAGSNLHQNTPNPAPGIWTISCTVCGQTKTASVDVP